jgi:MinD-like ATPase involved in chromosome partitioning or flagellar assembly/HPt (histidine-containing phosphotransfer) domain-containing protein
LRATREGVVIAYSRRTAAAGLGRGGRSVTEARTNTAPAFIAPPPKAGKVITFMGAKGGVGTTTVALNTGCALVRLGRVIVVELRPTFGTLSLYFSPPAQVPTIAQLLAMEPAAINTKTAEACLWSCQGLPGLRFLSGPRIMEQCREIAPAQVKALLTVLAQMADYVVVDIPPSLGETNRAVIENSSQLGLVVERDPTCVQSAQMVVLSMGMCNPPLQATGAVIVNRVALANPMPLSDIESRLGVPTLRVLPPAPDLFIAAQNAHAPVVIFDPESLVGGSLAALAERLASAPNINAAIRTQIGDPVEPAKTPGKILVCASKYIPQTMVVQYLSKCRNDLPALAAAVGRYDYEFVRIFGHQMKGTGGAYGFSELTKTGALIEQAAADENMGELRNEVASLEAYLGSVEVAFDQSPASE